jgi:hypothetical protein
MSGPAPHPVRRPRPRQRNLWFVVWLWLCDRLPFVIDPSLMDALAKAEGELDALRSGFDVHKATVEAELATLATEEQEVKRQARLVRSLRVAAGKYAGADLGDLETEIADADPYETWWLTAARTEAIVQTLKSFNVPISPATIVASLRNKGRTQDTPAAVSATLAHLARQGLVRSQGHGQWVATSGRPHIPPQGATPDEAARALVTGAQSGPRL